jgi:peptidyl-prolyl cis-trans isomerase C
VLVWFYNNTCYASENTYIAMNAGLWGGIRSLDQSKSVILQLNGNTNMKIANLLALVVVAGISAAIGYFVGTDMSGGKGEIAEKAAMHSETTDATAEKAEKSEMASDEKAAMAEKSETADKDDALVATVDGAQIRESDILRMYEALPDQYKQAPFVMIKAQLLEQMISMKIVQNAARAEKFNEQADFQGKVADIQDQLLQEYYLQKKIDAAVTEDALKAEYAKRVAEFVAEEEVKASHILLKTEDEAKDIISKLDAGGDFVELAKEFSTGPSGKNGGDLGFFSKTRMVPAFAEAAFLLEKGTYTKAPVKTQFGWHVIVAEDRRSTAAPAFEEMSKQITDELSGKTVTSLLETLRAKAAVDIVEVKPAMKDGDKASEEGEMKEGEEKK